MSEANEDNSLKTWTDEAGCLRNFYGRLRTANGIETGLGREIRLGVTDPEQLRLRAESDEAIDRMGDPEVMKSLGSLDDYPHSSGRKAVPRFRKTSS